MTAFAIFIHDGYEDDWESFSEEQKRRVYDTDAEFARLLAERGGRVTGGAELSHTRETRVVRRGDPVVTEGPFAESVEVLSGFYLVEGTDRDTLVELAAVLARVHDVVEIRQIGDEEV